MLKNHKLTPRHREPAYREKLSPFSQKTPYRVHIEWSKKKGPSSTTPTVKERLEVFTRATRSGKAKKGKVKSYTGRPPLRLLQQLRGLLKENKLLHLEITEFDRAGTLANSVFHYGQGQGGTTFSGVKRLYAKLHKEVDLRLPMLEILIKELITRES